MWMKWNHIWPFVIREEEYHWSHMVGFLREGFMSVVAGCSSFQFHWRKKRNHCSAHHCFSALENINAVCGHYRSLVTLPVECTKYCLCLSTPKPTQGGSSSSLFCAMLCSWGFLCLSEIIPEEKATDRWWPWTSNKVKKKGPFPAHMPWIPMKDT